MTDDLEQGSDEWVRARLGKVTASRVSDVMAGGKGVTRANYMAELIAEILNDAPIESYSNGYMDRGKEIEPEARAAYAFHRNVDVVEVGFVEHPTIERSGASPDGLIGDDGMVEIKAPKTAIHIATMLGKAPPKSYRDQMQWGMACTGRQWCDFVSYDPTLPEDYSMSVKRFVRDEAAIAEIEMGILAFLKEMDEMLTKMRKAAA